MEPASQDEILRVVLKHIEEEDDWRPLIEAQLKDHHRILVGTDDEPGIAPIVRDLHKILNGSQFTIKALVAICAFVSAVALTWDWFFKHFTMKA